MCAHHYKISVAHSALPTDDGGSVPLLHQAFHRRPLRNIADNIG
jgi:hypothetical protein